MNFERKKRVRGQEGVAVILLMFVLAFFFVGVLGVFAFEVARVNTGRDEIRSASEAAALSGAAVLASSNSTDPTTSHNNALAAAIKTFQANTILGVQMNAASATATELNNPPPGQTTVYVEFLDPNSNYKVVTDLSSTAGKVVHVVADTGYIPAFGKYVGIGNVNIRGDAQAAVPSLDIVMCFDCSASIDDQTKVTFVERYLNNTTNLVNYYIYDTGSGHQGSASYKSGALYQAINCTNKTGTSLNGCPPQNLDQINASASNNYTYDNGTRGGGTDYGTKPTNTKTPNMGAFTDEVVNIDGNDVFANGSSNGTFTTGGFAFPNVATLVEAARGNLESKQNFVNSGASTAVNGVPTAIATLVNNGQGAGYQKAYLTAAYAATAPIGQAQQAALVFFNIMNTNTDAHFAFLPFASKVYTASNSTGDAGHYVASNANNNVLYYGAGEGANNTQWPAHATQLSSTNQNYTTITNNASTTNNEVTQTIANGGTAIGNAIQEAGNELQLTAQGRKGSKKIILVFTDGLDNGSSITPAAAATAINQHNPSPNIAIYTIGLAQNSNVVQAEVDTLNAGGIGSTVTYTDPVTGNSAVCTAGANGVANIAKNGGQFFLVTNAATLNYVFENIARQLVALVRS